MAVNSDAEASIAPLTTGGRTPLASSTYDIDDIHAAQELYHANGWTDGLPIAVSRPPTCIRLVRADSAPGRSFMQPRPAARG